MNEGSGDSEGLAACRTVVSAAAPSAISDESGCTLRCEAGFDVGSGRQHPHTVARAQPPAGGCTGVRRERKSVASDCHGEPQHRAPNSARRCRPRMVSVMVQTCEDDARAHVDSKKEPPKAKPANEPQPPRLSLLIPKRPRDESVEAVDVDAYSAACHALWGGRTPQKVAAPSLRDFLAAKQEEVEENCEPSPGTLALVGLSPQSELELSPVVQGSQTDLVKTEAVSAIKAKPRGAPNASLPGSPDRSLASVDLLWSQALDPKQESLQSLGCQASEISPVNRQSTRRTLDFGTLSPPKHDGDCVPAWLQQIHAVKRGPQNLATEPESEKGLQADEIPTPCRRAGSARLNSNVRCQPMSPESDTESRSAMPASPDQEAPTALATCLGIAAPAPASVSTVKEGSPSASAASTAPATPSASPSPRAPVPEQTEVQASQCSEALEPLAAPVETMEVSAPSPGETPEHTARAEEGSDRLSDTECRAGADVKQDGAGLSQFCFAKTTQEDRREAATGSPSPSAASASAAPNLSQFAFVEARARARAKTTQAEAEAEAEAEAAPVGAAPSTSTELSGSSPSVIPVSLSQELPKEVGPGLKRQGERRGEAAGEAHGSQEPRKVKDEDQRSPTLAEAGSPTLVMAEVADAHVLRTFNAAVISGVAGGCAQVMYVFPLMWLRTIMEYQYKNGEGTVKVARTLYREGGVARFYRGLMLLGGTSVIWRYRTSDAAFAQSGEIPCLVAEAANELALSSLAKVEMPLALKTLCASVTAATFRVVILPLDAWKVNKQVHGKAGLQVLVRKATVNPLSLWHGGLGVLVTGAFGHYPWFYTNNLLREILPPFEMRYGKHVRHAFIGFTSSVVADTICNPIRVLKVNRQTSLSRISYLEAASRLCLDLLTWFLALVRAMQAHGIIQKEGLMGLWSRGLKTRIFANGVQGSLFTVGWRYFSEVHSGIPQPFHRPVWTKRSSTEQWSRALGRPLPAELGGPVALTPAGPASTAPSPEALEVKKKGKQGRHADSEVSASMLEVRRGISDDDSDAPLAKRIKRRRATAPARLTPGKAPAPKAAQAKARRAGAALSSARPTPSQAQESESKAPDRSKKRAAPSRQEPSNKCRKAAASKDLLNESAESSR
ncbi:unnamed protein product [Symbiodinium sp. CCMP2456]|nr:unnamed protein product [Symbiodinium sp. CCMP2456]